MLKPLIDITQGQYEAFLEEEAVLRELYEGPAQRAAYRRMRIQAAVAAKWFADTSALAADIDDVPIQTILELNAAILGYLTEIESADADFLSVLLTQLEATGVLQQSSLVPATASNGTPSPDPAE